MLVVAWDFLIEAYEQTFVLEYLNPERIMWVHFPGSNSSEELQKAEPEATTERNTKTSESAASKKRTKALHAELEELKEESYTMNRLLVSYGCQVYGPSSTSDGEAYLESSTTCSQEVCSQ